MSETLTLVERLTRIADAAKRPDGTDSPLSEELRSAISALEAAQTALEPFARMADVAADIASRHQEPVAGVARVPIDDCILARSVHSMLIGEDKTKGEEE